MGFPTRSIEHSGIGPSPLIGAVVCALGLLVTHLWAPGTTDLRLTDAAAAEATGQ